VVLDSDWEAELARVLERHPRVRAYVKNQGMSFDVPYRDGAVPRKYVPDFIVQLDDGREDALNLILETKGY
jgi:type III restriction enzyme